jgi:hypothetical protein
MEQQKNVSLKRNKREKPSKVTAYRLKGRSAVPDRGASVLSLTTSIESMIKHLLREATWPKRQPDHSQHATS